MQPGGVQGESSAVSSANRSRDEFGLPERVSFGHACAGRKPSSCCRSVVREAGLLRGRVRFALLYQRIAQVDRPVDAQDFERIARLRTRVGPFFPLFRAFAAHTNTTPTTKTTTPIRKRRIPSFKYRNRSDIVPSFRVWACARCASTFRLRSSGSPSMSRSNSTGFGGSSYLVTKSDEDSRMAEMTRNPAETPAAARCA